VLRENLFGLEIDPRGRRPNHISPPLPPCARFSKRVNSRMKASFTTPVGPLRCLAMISSAVPADSVGGAFAWAQNPAHWRFSPGYPGLTPVLLGSLKSPYTDEMTVGAIKRLGNNGVVRVDYVHRDYGSFYVTQTDLSTGFVTDPAGSSIDRAVIMNDSKINLDRKYDGLHFSAQYRAGTKLTLGGNYALSKSKGNFVGETITNGPITYSNAYPEFTEARWNRPTGYLPIDQRHRLRLFGAYDVLTNRFHRLNVGLAQYYSTGAPYSAVGTVDVRTYVTNPGYKSPTYTYDYYFSKRGEYRLDDVTSTDLAITYTFVPKLGGHDIEIYLKPEVRNVFNEHAVTNVDTNVDTNYDNTTMQKFDPFNTEPVEGVNWIRTSTFGKPQAPTDYQTARTYLLAAGIRF